MANKHYLTDIYFNFTTWTEKAHLFKWLLKFQKNNLHSRSWSKTGNNSTYEEVEETQYIVFIYREKKNNGLKQKEIKPLANEFQMTDADIKKQSN